MGGKSVNRLISIGILLLIQYISCQVFKVSSNSQKARHGCISAYKSNLLPKLQGNGKLTVLLFFFSLKENKLRPLIIKVRTSFPCIVKVGHAHDGLGKIQIKNPLDFQDITSIVSIANTYTTTEPYFESKCDIHIQKIGSVYKAYM